MILYKKKPKKLSIGGWISDLGGGDSEFWTAAGNLIDPMGTTLDTFDDPTATDEAKWNSVFNMATPNPVTSGYDAQGDIDRADEAEAEIVAEKDKKKQSAINVGAQGAYTDRANTATSRADMSGTTIEPVNNTTSWYVNP